MEIVPFNCDSDRSHFDESGILHKLNLPSSEHLQLQEKKSDNLEEYRKLSIIHRFVVLRI